MSDERGCRLVRLSERYLMIPRIGIQKTQDLISDREIYDLVYAGRGNRSEGLDTVPRGK
jgi:hypothetical protein